MSPGEFTRRLENLSSENVKSLQVKVGWIRVRSLPFCCLSVFPVLSSPFHLQKPCSFTSLFLLPHSVPDAYLEF